VKLTSSSTINKLILIPSLIWIICGITLCIIKYNEWYYYTAVLLPPAFVLTSYLITKVFKLFGGILLLANGLIFTIFILKSYTFIESIIMICTFTLPIITSGTLIILTSLRLIRHYSRNQYIISEKLPL
jgi:hypothetical protein